MQRVLTIHRTPGTDHPAINADVGSGSFCSLNITRPNDVLHWHRTDVAAGSDIILTNTLAANRRNFDSGKMAKIIREGVVLAKRAAQNTIVFGQVGPLGDQISPDGKKDFEEVVQEYKRIFKCFVSAGLCRFLLTSFTSVIEAKAAFLAARKYADNILVCIALGENGLTVLGETPEGIALIFEALDADGVGVDSPSPNILTNAVAGMRRVSDIPLIVMLDSRQPGTKNRSIPRSISDAERVRYYHRFIEEGANIIGACNISRADVRAPARKSRRLCVRKRRDSFFLVSSGKAKEFKPGQTAIVGERLNPSGRKRLRAEIKRGVYSIYGKEARQQEQTGADAIDINAFVDVLDEKDTLANAVRAVMIHTGLPLFIDTQDYEAAEIVLRFYPGIGVCNSIPATRKAMKRWLPMVHRYGFKAVISLAGKTLPRNTEERVKNAKLALKVAREIGFPINDLIFDPLVLPVATCQDQLRETLMTVHALQRMNLKTILGISNVSYGLPNRSLLNAALAAVAVSARTTFIIVNALDPSVMGAVAASNALWRGVELARYIERSRRAEKSGRSED